MKFEYNVVGFDSFGETIIGKLRHIEILCQFGEMQWELVAVTQVCDRVLHYFKREVKDPNAPAITTRPIPMIEIDQ